MWICAKCGEPHEDQFRDCWKCVGAGPDSERHELPSQGEPAAPAAAERPLRSTGSIVFRVLIGFVAGTLGGVAVFHRHGATLEQASILGAIVGVLAAVAVGVFVWVVFPFKPPAPSEPQDSARDSQI
jgi:hypothetical protein